MIYFTSMSTTPLEFLLGRYAPPPPDLGVWRETGRTSREGWVEEERRILPAGKARAAYYLLQVRYREPSTRQIVRVVADVREKRPRVSSRGN
jgi:hypothetical protein